MSGLNSQNVPGYQELAKAMQPSEDGWKAPLHQDWKQGRTAYGGLSTALALEAVYQDHNDLPPLRSATINFIGPVSADPVYRTNLLRHGRNVTMVEAKGYVEGNPVISVTFSFGASR